MITLTQAKQAIRDSDKDTIREIINTYDRDVLEAGLNLDILPSNIEEAYQGQYKDDEDFAQELADQIGAIDRHLSWPHTCIDWTRAARELMYDYCEDNGYYFRNL